MDQLKFPTIMVDCNLNITAANQIEETRTVSILRQKLPEEMFISPASLNVTTVIGQGGWSGVILIHELMKPHMDIFSWPYR